MNIHFLSESEYLVKDVSVDHIHERPFCIFDLEGTGIDVETEYITQFGAIIYQNGKILRKFSTLVKSPKLIPKSVEQLTGITNERLTDAPAFAEAYGQFLDFCGTAVLVTQLVMSMTFQCLKDTVE
ncbi:3'-5' exonuclease [Paenibacillus sp. sptzw28]|uniref:3'-5' exonuclease n=1 Tax=Paenibacillus sp. sptzw28 TaxID=715179 RepID=UPI001C6F53D5|nr:3'-5' exonuclease [Paenibacillus sp. sptzw28]QYR22322.1 3'-5' exonuclease [Paenibacillus sp. sptzw28]